MCGSWSRERGYTVDSTAVVGGGGRGRGSGGQYIVATSATSAAVVNVCSGGQYIVAMPTHQRRRSMCAVRGRGSGGQCVTMPTRQRRWSVCGGGQYIVASSAAVVVNI